MVRNAATRIALLRNRGGDASGNSALIGAALAGLGVRPAALDIDSLSATPSGLWVTEDDGTRHALGEWDALWLFGFGSETSTLDRFQLLESHLPSVRYVSRPSAIIAWHAKQTLISVPPPLRLPNMWVGGDAEWLFEATRETPCVIKPTAGSFGRGVEPLAEDEGAALAQLRAATRDGRYVLLQQRVASDTLEHRVLVAGASIVGSYARRPASGRFAANLANDASAVRGRLEDRQLTACARLGEQLAAEGIGYAGIDLLWPWVLEVNVVNPGGLSTLVELGDRHAPRRAVSAVLDNLG